MNDSELHQELALAIAHLSNLMAEFERRRVIRIQEKKVEAKNAANTTN